MNHQRRFRLLHLRQRALRLLLSIALPAFALPAAACVIVPPDWTYEVEPRLYARLGELLDYDPGSAPQGGVAGGVLVAREDMNKDGQAEWLVVPDHLCTVHACEFALLSWPTDGGEPRVLYRGVSHGLPYISGHRAGGWRTLVRLEPEGAPLCCTPRVAIQVGIDDGQESRSAAVWGDLGPMAGDWPVIRARNLGIERQPYRPD